MKFCSYLSITFTSNTVLAFMNLPYHISDSRNDGNAHCVARHFVEPTVRKTCCDGLVELFISKALKPPAFNRHELSDPASVPYAMPILRCDGKHLFLRLFESSALLPYGISVGIDHCSWFFFNQNSRMFPAPVTYS